MNQENHRWISSHVLEDPEDLGSQDRRDKAIHNVGLASRYGVLLVERMTLLPRGASSVDILHYGVSISFTPVFFFNFFYLYPGSVVTKNHYLIPDPIKIHLNSLNSP